jgi:hypothetical protein
MSITDAQPLAEFDGVLLDGLDFCRRTYALFERLRTAPDGPTRLRLRASNTEKKLLEELLPICKYIHFYYRVGRYISVRWIDGDQSFDAEISQQGTYIDKGYYPATAHLEVTGAMHANEHWIWKLLSSGRGAFAPEGISKTKGRPVESEPVVFTNHQHVEQFVPIVVGQLTKKAGTAYPANTSLVVQCSLNSLYTRDDWDLLVREVHRQVPVHSFREILLYDGTREFASPLA